MRRKPAIPLEYKDLLKKEWEKVGSERKSSIAIEEADKILFQTVGQRDYHGKYSERKNKKQNIA